MLERGGRCFGVCFANLHASTLGSAPCSTPLVPVFSFGENDLFEQVRNPKGSWLRQLQHRLQQIMGISLPLFHARGIFQYSFGLIPYRRPICTVGKSSCMLARYLAKARDWGQPLGCVVPLTGWSIMLGAFPTAQVSQVLDSDLIL